MDVSERSTTCIPDEEITHLLLTLTDAFQLAAAGEPRRGYLKVLGGMVRTSSFTLEEHAWAYDLRAHWDRALREYLERHPGSDLDDRLFVSTDFRWTASP